MSFILAVIVALFTVAACALVLLADMQSPTGRGGPNPLWPAIIGFGLAALIAASHWLPHIGW